MNQGPYTINEFIYFDDGDPAGIVFFPNYFRLAMRAFEQGLRLSGIEWNDWFHHPEWGVPLRYVESDFRKPLRPGSPVEIRQGVAKLGESSVVLRTEFSDSEKHLCAIVFTTHVFVTKANLEKRPIPVHLRRFLETKQFP